MSAAPPGERDPREILVAARTIAVVGLSSDPSRPSHSVAAYLQRAGYRIVPVNPNETEVLGEPAYPSLLDVDVGRVDAVDVFRRAEHTPAVARDAVRIGTDLLWLQQGIVSEEARSIAEAGGLVVVMDACIRTAHRMWMDARQEGEDPR